MKKSLFILSIATVALSIVGCSSSQPSGSNQAQQPQATETPQPASSPSPAAATPEAEKSSQPKTAEKKESVVGLIPSTNPAQRRQKIAQGRKDPFAFVPVKPTPKLNPQQLQPQSNTPQPPTASSPQPSAPSPFGSSPTPIRPPAPLPPQPEIAQAVAITGIIDMGGVTQIIVKAPGERASRYVRVGDYLSNGQVRVKRIENARSATPVVVLEELGQEVYKNVGEGVAQQPSQTKPDREEKTALSLPESLTGGF
ncbi:hypothetical protein NIES593_18535 [Hydrococcus rivularis NIES-593]|uniref:Pilus assembly protein PilP n=1 Tax=Hydrococcus rivularis NIES-593 TaxID=1921803 RepID=A0A1U7HAE2_9CYAN|nr:hypothetical protein [Hydrococcus rivularis]OKH20511.1 hypothetical protein NIES593_18535 [Hydrococcus rivularis NIES-593]